MKKLIIAFSVFTTVIVCSSFSSSGKHATVPAKQTQSCANVTCDWYPTTSNLAYASLSDCCTDDSQTNVGSGGFSASISYTGAMIEITTDVGTTHPAGTINIYRNGNPTPVHSHSLTVNQAMVCTAFFTHACGDAYTVTW